MKFPAHVEQPSFLIELGLRVQVSESTSDELYHLFPRVSVRTHTGTHVCELLRR